MNELPDSGFFIQFVQKQVSSAYQLRTHHHPFFELLYILEGETQVVIREQTWRAGPGDLLIYFPYEDHTETVEKGIFSYIWIRFHSALTRREQEELLSATQLDPLIHLPWPERFQQIFNQMIIESQIKDPWNRVILQGYLLVFSGLLQRANLFIHEQRGTKTNGTDLHFRIQQALEHIHRNLSANLSIKTLATRVFMSESHFTHTFKELVGIAPKQYFLHARIQKAQELLQTTSLSIREIASHIGYEDSHYFARVFRKLVGVSPSGFRRNSKK